MPHNWDEAWRWLVALAGVLAIYRLAVFLNDLARGAKSRAKRPTTWRHWLMLPLAPFLPIVGAASLVLGLILVAVSWALGKAWPLLPVREAPVLPTDDRVRRKTIAPTRYPFWACARGQTGWVHVAVEIAPDGVYRDHRVVDASPADLFDRSVARALSRTTYETIDGSPLPDGIETLYKFVPPPPAKARRASVATPAAT